MRRARGGGEGAGRRGAPAVTGGVRGAAEAPPGAGRACAAEGRRMGASAGPSPRRGEAGERGRRCPAGARPGGGTGVSQPAAAGGREKLGQQQQRKDKMAAAQEEVRSEVRARGWGVCSGTAQLVGAGERNKGAILEPGKGEAGRKAAGGHLRAGQSL